MIIQPKRYEGRHPAVSKPGPYSGRFAPHRNGLYSACLTAAADPASEFYHRHSDGTLYQRTGAAHRSAFWAGYEEAFTGERNKLKRGDPTSDAATCYRAGLDFGKADRATVRESAV